MKMPESTVILTGQVFLITPTTDFTSKEDNGAKVAILGGGGATEVKVDLDQLGTLRPIVGDQIAWHVQPFPWEMANASGVSFLFRARADMGSLDALHSIVAAPEAVPTK